MSARTSNSPSRSSHMSSLTALAFAGLAALAPAMSGCEIPVAMLIADDINNDDEVYNDGPYGGYYGSDQSALETKNARLSGDLGLAVGFSGDADWVDAYHDGYYTSITIWASGDGWAAMSALSIGEGGISGDDFKPGAKLSFGSSEYGGSNVTSYGCSGTGGDADILDYEASGTRTDIEVSEGEEEGMLHLSITTVYTNYEGEDQVVESELDVVVPE